MAWVKLGSQSGWTVYWEDRDHRMYARGDGNIFGDKQKDFSGRYADRVTAWAVFADWARNRR